MTNGYSRIKKGDNMRIAIVLVLVALVAVISISGCTQNETGPSGELTANQMEEDAFKAMENEMDAMENINLDELENELLI
jgi:outer membrane lipoprotein-sorting protein